MLPQTLSVQLTPSSHGVPLLAFENEDVDDPGLQNLQSERALVSPLT